MTEHMTAVLLLAFGGPEDLLSIEPFLKNILVGRPVTPELVERVRSRYAMIGGKSPLPEITRTQAQLLEERLGAGFRVYAGMRHWHPYIKDVVRKIKDDGITRIIAMPMAPQSSKASTGGYIDALKIALEDISGLDASIVKPWHINKRYLRSVSDTVMSAIQEFPSDRQSEVSVIFSAHSLPVRTVADDPYVDQLKETIDGVVTMTGIINWHLAYQSKGQAPGEWLGPDTGEVMEMLAGQGRKEVLIVPIGFVCDHVETLYDIDILFRKKADELGMHFRRSASLNVSEGFIAAMEDIIRSHTFDRNRLA